MTGDRIAVGAALGLVAASLALAAWVDGRGGDGASAATSPSATTAGAPSVDDPLRDPRALAVAKRSGDVLFGLAASEGGPVAAVVLTADGPPPAGALEAMVDGAGVPVTSCGEGCFELAVSVLDGAPSELELSVARTDRPSASARFDLPAALPPSGRGLYREVERVMGALPTVRVDETLTAGLGEVIRTRYELQAPDRMRFHTSEGQETVIVGRKRWDRQDGTWSESPFPRSVVPEYVWQGASRARVLARRVEDGTRLTVLALYRPDPTFPTWYRLLVEDGSRVREVRMLGPSHFMVNRFSRYGTPLAIEPPVG